MHFRYARHTNQLIELENFYITILGFKKLGEFKNHNRYDGIFLGFENQDWHIEFTQSEEVVDHSFDEDDVLVFYPETEVEYEEIIKNIIQNKQPMNQPKNPYWRENGKLIKDPDGYGIIISPLKIKAT